MNKKNILLILSMLSLVSGNALAYDTKDDDEVTKERNKSEYAQQGIHVGSFNVYPKLDMTNQYDSNIYKRDKKIGGNAVVDSYIAHFKPGVDARSNWSRHALNLKFDSDLPQYARHGEQNDYEDLFTKLDGRIDVVRDSYLSGEFAYNSLHEDRGSPDQINGKSPTFFDTKNMNAFYSHKLNRVTVKGGGDAMRYDYQDVLSSLGTKLTMSTRNHWEYAPSIRLGYEIQPEYEAFVKFLYKQADYDTLVSSNGAGTAYNRNSTGYNMTGGMAFDLTDLVTGDMSVGYLQRSYTDARFKSISGINGFVNLKWRPTALTTVNGKFSHDINETTQEGVGGVLASGISLGVQHELLRNLNLIAEGTFSNNDYQGFVAPNLMNRNDKVYGGNVSAEYLFDKHFSTNLAYNYQSRDVNYVLVNYEVHQVMLNLRGHF